jgi:trimethylamine:corrinoid methyltransferase-like protein
LAQLSRTGAPLTGQVGHEHQFTGLAFGVAGEQLIDQASGWLGNGRGSGVVRTMHQAGRRDQD